jgi:hypothetical protein
MRFFVTGFCVLFAVAPLTNAMAASQDDTHSQARVVDILSLPQNPAEDYVQSRINAHLARAQHIDDAPADLAPIVAVAVRVTPRNSVAVDVQTTRRIDQLELSELNDEIASAVAAIRPLALPSTPSVALYFNGIPAFDVICANDKNSPKDDTPPVAGQDVLVVSAAHGLYRYNASAGPVAWMTQRNAHHGIVEDFLTPVYAERLKKLVLAERPNRPRSVHLVRQAFSPHHRESGRPWIELGANYTIQRLLPQRADIWGFSCDEVPLMEKDPERDRKSDLNSRPLYANHLNADGIINLHTNASCRRLRPGDPRPPKRGDCGRGRTVDPDASGMLIFYDPESAASKRLAEMVSCSVKQGLKTDYPDYPISEARPRTDLAELNLAKRASVIVELGFHTNPSDAALLKSEAFQERSMAALATAWRRYVNQEPCE